MRRLKINRTLLKVDYPWLESDILKDTTVYRYPGPTYGVISGEGVAVTLEDQEETEEGMEQSFFEVPLDSILDSAEDAEVSQRTKPHPLADDFEEYGDDEEEDEFITGIPGGGDD